MGLIRRCPNCEADITTQLDASYEHGYAQGYEKRAEADETDHVLAQQQLRGAVEAMRALPVASIKKALVYADMDAPELIEPLDAIDAYLGGQ